MKKAGSEGVAVNATGFTVASFQDAILRVIAGYDGFCLRESSGALIGFEAPKMSDPLGWPIWLQIPLLFVLITGAALEWFVTGYGGLHSYCIWVDCGGLPPT